MNTTLTITMISVVAATMSLMARQNDNAPNSEMPMLVSEVSVPSDLKGKLAQVTRAEGAQQEMEAMDLLFCGASDGDIDVLRHQAHVGVALRAAWEQLCHTLPEGELWMDFEKPSVRHFVGFLEGRLRITLPVEWVQTVAAAKAYSRTHVVFAEDACWPTVKTQAGFMASPGIEIDEVAGLRIDGNSIPGITSEMIGTQRSKGNSCVCARVGTENSYCAFYSDVISKFDLYCVLRESGSLRWVAQIYPTGSDVLHLGGESFHRVVIVERESDVAVFGVGLAAYIEAVNIADGSASFRFSTYGGARE